MRKSTDRDPQTGRFLPKNKAALRSGTEIYLRTGKLPSQIRGAARLKKDLVRIRSELERELGDNLNIRSELLINQIITCEGFLKLFELYVKRLGILDPISARKNRVDFMPGFQTYQSFQNRQIVALRELGINEGQHEKIISPLQLARELDAEKAESSEG